MLCHNVTQRTFISNNGKAELAQGKTELEQAKIELEKNRQELIEEEEKLKNTKLELNKQATARNIARQLLKQGLDVSIIIENTSLSANELTIIQKEMIDKED
ncbi:hypothetical protein [Gracilibacillus alcaliphilus]|uniref:hypothetical protein n=1 Tax=Gracilibacillus alcaliphilus TaxID=1401441 RepID=UPI00195C3B67|nr:hypothetical protein [Gracilibacillus alcaliphilus]MBM7675325.1 hypothetical protein [Gracilibacillus alcaliphilus]